MLFGPNVKPSGIVIAYVYAYVYSIIPTEPSVPTGLQ